MPDVLDALIEHWRREAARWKAEAKAKECAQCQVAAEAYEAVISDAEDAKRDPAAVVAKVHAERNTVTVR